MKDTRLFALGIALGIALVIVGAYELAGIGAALLLVGACILISEHMRDAP